jgi:hypothetical protein
MQPSNMHLDHHAMWIDPKNSDHMINGNDGGLNITYDRGKNWVDIREMQMAEFYAISVDNQEPYNIYGGLQDNGSHIGPSNHTPTHGVDCPWESIGGGDGFFVEPDPSDNNTVYYESQFGNISRRNLVTGQSKGIKPESMIGEAAMRCNWASPFILSKFNSRVIYFGAQNLYMSLDRGDHWESISPDLTTNPGPERQGDVTFGSISTISESPFSPRLLYVGTDDGNIQVTRDGGGSWELISEKLPSHWTTRVIASKYNKSTVYATFSAYRKDIFETFIYKSDDYGKTWKSLKGNLPEEPVNVIREDPNTAGLLYIGTDVGVYASLDNGGNWVSLVNDLPTTPVHDLVIQAREKELVIGTHGRGIFILDVSYIEELVKEEASAKPLYISSIDDIYKYKQRGDEKQKTSFYVWAKDSGKLKLSILDSTSKVLTTIKKEVKTGINKIEWDLSNNKDHAVEKGDYSLVVSQGKEEEKREFTIK